MITPEEAYENPELMIKYKDDLKDINIFRHPWYAIFRRYPYLYREFSDRFDELGGVGVSFALMNDLTLISDLKDYLHKMCGWDISNVVRNGPILILDLRDYLHKLDDMEADWLLKGRPEVSLCLKHRNNPDKVEAAYYVPFPRKLDGLDNEEKREMSERIIELLKEEKA